MENKITNPNNITAGGLVQISNYGAQDLFLTNNPEITFFQLIYRRYTNFGRIYVENKFNNNVDFNNTSVLNIPKAYDLLSNLILKIKLPTINIDSINKLLIKNNAEEIKKMFIEYKYFINFYSKLLNIINIYFSSSYESDYILGLKTKIESIIADEEFNIFYGIVSNFFPSVSNTNYYKNASLYYNTDDIKTTYIYENVSEDFYSFEMFKTAIYENMDILEELKKIMYEKILILSKSKKVIVNWIDKIAIYLFDTFEIFIGSNSISKLSSNFVDTYGQVQYTNKILYNQLINENSDYLYLQVPFWFTQSYGSSIPLISLHFNDVQFKITTKKLIDVINITLPDLTIDEYEKIKSIITQTFLNELYTVLSSQLDITVLTEYISLDNMERKKFVQSGHEYLITQVQEVSYSNITTFDNYVVLNFYYCCKDLYWNCTRRNNFGNILGKNKYDKYYFRNFKNYSNKDVSYIKYLNILYNNFYSNFRMIDFLEGLSIAINTSYDNLQNDIGLINSNIIEKVPYVKTSDLQFNSVSVINQENNYFNYAQQFSYYNSTLDLGNCVYSFSLNPCDIQPSGSCNLGRIPYVSLRFTFNDSQSEEQIINELYDELDEDLVKQYCVRIYAVNYNVLRFLGGICGLAYQFS